MHSRQSPLCAATAAMRDRSRWLILSDCAKKANCANSERLLGIQRR